MTSRVANASKTISVIARWLSGFGLILMTAIIAWQVFARYVLNASLAWAEQAALLLMIWYVFIAAAAGVREGFHIRISVFADSLPPRLKRTVGGLCHVVVLLFGAAMAWWGVGLATAVAEHVIPTLGVSRALAYIPIILSGVLIVLFSLEQLVAVLRNTEVEQEWN